MRTVVARGAIRLLEAVDRRRARKAPPPQIRDIHILLLHANGMGGTIRTVLNLAGELAKNHNVEIVSVIREQEHPFFPIPEGVSVTYLDDRLDGRRGGPLRRLLVGRPSRLIPKEEAAHHRFTAWTDLALVRYLRSRTTGVVIATRPGLNLITARFAPPGVITIGQEHVGLTSHADPIQTLLKRRYPRLDALVTLTKADLANYRATLRRRPRRLTRIPNALPPLSGGPSALTGKTVVAVGRLTRVKGFHKLLAAWEQVTAAHPDWTLRIYGAGSQEENLAQDIQDRGLTGSAFLMGAVADVGPALQEASVFAMTSRHEGFSLTLLEAMSKGLAIVSFDSPHGPREMLTNGHDALLVKPRNPETMAERLCQVIENDELRRSLGRTALSTVRQYDPSVIGERWESLLEELLRDRQTPLQSGSKSSATTRRPEPPLRAAPSASKL
ncbi:glycosyltransferase family 4 protein [Spongiactinospora sp. TRM90649]|uniref:glycosyltransferase family 4 protein n=1 Tax=Spongiactinospora sp. TRM90649 TaxID=3031114 RepID=UPI0023F64ADC|nr:glycosyltransferase family 4 protein [Spongiactinospora sp. TRM90649]MDF5758006.1 glycosyltransferase family 4 protein [Spongiactinospora sp. TRM90649]